MLIRRAHTDELEAVGEITVAAYQDFLLGPTDPYAVHLADAPARDRGAEVWVAVDDAGALLGSVTYCPEGSPWRELAGPGEGEFRMLSVAPEARGRGVGETLVRHVLERSREAGYRNVVISSLPEMSGAHRIYDRLGFVREPGLDWTPVPGVSLIAFRVDLQH